MISESDKTMSPQETSPIAYSTEFCHPVRRKVATQSTAKWFLSPFGDMTLWNILASCVVLPYISPYLRMTNRMLWGHILSVVPETSSMAGGARFHLDTSHHRPDPFVT
jgi:hypothetical protein